MSMIYCPECNSRISANAVTCPHCGFTASNVTCIVPISSLPPSRQDVRIIVPEASVFDGALGLIPESVNRELVSFFSNADNMARFAPGIYDIVKKLAERGDIKYVADFTASAEELMRSGELVLSVERETGALLPQLRSVKTGQIYEKARLHAEQMPLDIMPSVMAMQMQAAMVAIMQKIESVATAVEALRIENQADRVAQAESAWQQLQQALSIKDARLREAKILDIAAAATEARCTLQGNFKAELSLMSKKKGKAKDLGIAANTALADLTVIALMARTEYAALSLLDEAAAANTALTQFKVFIEENRLDKKDTLKQINSASTNNRDDIVNGFFSISNDIVKMQLSGTEEPLGLLDGLPDDDTYDDDSASRETEGSDA